MPKSTLSHHMQQFKGALGVGLLSRTSRRFGMTEAGDAFITALLPGRNGLLPSVRAFVNHLAAEFREIVPM